MGAFARLIFGLPGAVIVTVFLFLLMGALIKGNLRLEDEKDAVSIDITAQIEDTEPKMRRDVALYQKEKADTEAKNDIRVRYARKAAAVSKQDYENALDVNKKVRDAIPRGEVRRLKLAWDQTDLQIENSRFEIGRASCRERV